MDQRNSLKIKCCTYLTSLSYILDNKKFGINIKLLSRSFNWNFVDHIDLENYKNFVEIIYDVIKGEYKLKRKLFKDYQILDICLNNINLLGKEYLLYLYSNIIGCIFTNMPGGMQPHRDIIDMCKKGFNKTGYIECYYYLAYLINHMCICCYKSTNAKNTAYKYYQICLDSEYETYSMYIDLIEICHDFIMNDNIDKEKKEKYFEQIVKYFEKTKNEKYKEERFYKNIRFLVESSIKLDKKEYLDLIIDIIDYKDYIMNELCKLLCFYHNYQNDYTRLLEKIKIELEPNKFDGLMVNVNFNLGNYDEMFSNLYFLIDYNYDKKNKESRITDNKIIKYMLKNSNTIDNNIFVKLIDYYNKFSYHYDWKIIFILFFDKLIGMGVDKKYLDEKINLLKEKKSGYTFLIHKFDKNDTQIAKYFINGIFNITNYLIRQNNENENENKEVIKNFINFLSNINPYCDYDNIINSAYINPFGPEKLDELNLYLSLGEPGEKETWKIVQGEDPDYDLVYPTYSDYYDALYGIKKNSPDLDNKITETNNYIQDKINLVKKQIDVYLKK